MSFLRAGAILHCILFVCFICIFQTELLILNELLLIWTWPLNVLLITQLLCGSRYLAGPGKVAVYAGQKCTQEGGVCLSWSEPSMPCGMEADTKPCMCRCSSRGRNVHHGLMTSFRARYTAHSEAGGGKQQNLKPSNVGWVSAEEG